MRDDGNLRHSDTGAVRSALDRADQRGFLRPPVAGACGHLRPAQYHQLYAWRAVHAGRLLLLVLARALGHRLLVGAAYRPGRRCGDRRPDRAHHALAPLQARSPLRPAADFRHCAHDTGVVHQVLRQRGTAVSAARGVCRRLQPRFHVAAEIPRMGDPRLGDRLFRHMVRHRAHQARFVPARGDRESGAGAGLRHQRPAHGHADLWFRRGTGRVRRRDGGADLPGESADGREYDHRRLRGRGHWRDGLYSRRHTDRVWPGRRRGPDQGVLSRGVEHRHLRGHGDRAADQARGAVRQGAVAKMTEPVAAVVPAPHRQPGIMVAMVVMAALLAAAPFAGIYPVFLMKALSFALFACAFNLLIGFGGLLSFGHAMFLGTAGYVCAHAAKEWGWPPEAAILAGTSAAAALGLVPGVLAIRRQGIYFAMITLALAQMIYFFCLQAPFTHGEDGIQSVPRGRLFGLLDLSNSLTMYYFVLVVFIAAFALIYRIINSPFGQVLKAIRENEPRAISLGYDAERYQFLAFAPSAPVAGA